MAHRTAIAARISPYPRSVVPQTNDGALDSRKAKRAAKRREAQAQQKLRSMGVCPVGYRWIKQASGYRCAGGSHYVSDAELGL